MAMEYLDVLDEAGNPTGEVWDRERVHAEGAWHAVFHLWIVNGDGNVLLQRRSHRKSFFGGFVDVTVGGHLEAGESVLDGVREAQEEVGIDVNPSRLHELGRWEINRAFDNGIVSMIDREHQYVYALVDTRPLHRYRLDPAEVDALYEVPLHTLRDLYGQDRPINVQGIDWRGRPVNARITSDHTIPTARKPVTEQLERLAGMIQVAEPQK